MSADLVEPLSEAELLAEIARSEVVQNAEAARQADLIRRFARAHVRSQTASGRVEPKKVEKSIATQVGLACRVSPSEGGRRMRVARDLHAGLDGIRGLFAAGVLSAYKVGGIVTATSHLSPAERAEVDRELVAQCVEKLGVRRIGTLATMSAARVAPEKFTGRCRAARSGRRVTIRPAADGMAYLSAFLPVEQAAAGYAALCKAVNDAAVSPEPVIRGRGQIMADTFVERLTGQSIATAVNAEIQILVPLEALLDPTSDLPAEIPGHGPIPADQILTSEGRKTWRRLITSDGIIIGGDSRKRAFTGTLAALIRARDGHRCREAYCDAPIRHIDHIERWSDGGRTSFENGRGLCEFHNLVRETPGWGAKVVDGSIVTTTPTGHTYESGLDTVPLRGRRRSVDAERPTPVRPAPRSQR